MRALLALGLGLMLACPAMAQDRAQTLADIRQQLAVLFVEVQQLRTELSTTGAPTMGAGGGSVLDRVGSVETELQRLTSKIEELENRINRIVSDGTNRIGDLEFRVCELEEGCDFSEIVDTQPLGGLVEGGVPAIVPGGQTGGSQPVGQQSDFDRAKAAYDAGDFAGAAALFQSFTQTYTAGDLYGAAHYWRGEALSQTGDTAGAARAFLESFSGAPGAELAPQALYRLGQSLGDLGQVQEACVTLGEVGVRFPGSTSAIDAQNSRQALGCQ